MFGHVPAVPQRAVRYLLVDLLLELGAVGGGPFVVKPQGNEWCRNSFYMVGGP